MREIKFRGKRVDNQKWVYGLPTRYPANVNKINAILLDDYFENDFGMVGGHVQHVELETVSQFTGLHDDAEDCEDKEIYDGDILQIEIDGEIIKCKVKMEIGAWMIISDEFEDGYMWLHELAECDGNFRWIPNSKVIGNKWDKEAGE